MKTRLFHRVSLYDSLESKIGSGLGWIVCDILSFVDNGLEALQNQVQKLLVISSADYEGSSELKQAWSYFRNVASFLLIVIGLVMIIGQAIGKD